MKPLMPVDEALALLLADIAAVTECERLPLQQAVGRVLAEDVVSAMSVPPADNSAMDGYAVCSGEVAQPLPISQRIPAGTVGAPLAAGTAVRIFTGAPVPEGADAVVMQERCCEENGLVQIDHAPKPGENIRRCGEDIAAGQVVLSAGQVLTPQAVALAASIGVPALQVRRRLRVAVFFTGDELHMPGEDLAPGGIYNTNRFVLIGLLEQCGCEVIDLGQVADRLDATREALRAGAAKADLILTSGGVSVGEEDHVKPAVEAEGVLALWKIAIKPGKPLAFGRIGSTAFIGLPGNPVASFVTFEVFVRPFLRKAQGITTPATAPYCLRADFDWPRPDRRREFLRVRRNAAGGLDLFPNQGSGVLTSTVWADGLVDNPSGQAIAKGDLVRFIPLNR